MTDVTRIIKYTGADSGVIRDGDIVFLSAPQLGIVQRKAPDVLSVGCIIPSGYYGATNNGSLDTRFQGVDVLVI